MTDREPRYRFRGNVKPSAEVSRPVAARRNAANPQGSADGTSATLDIFDVIDSWGGWWGISARDVDTALAEIGDVDTLYVRVNSPGGEALEGVAIGNILRAHAAKVRVTVYGLAASAASGIAMAGDHVNMAPGSMMMIHDAWNIVLGNPDELRAEAEVLDKLSNGYAALYAKRAGGTAADWRTKMRAETWYTAEEAVADKLADAVAVDPAPSPTPAAEDDVPVLVEMDLGFDSAADRFDLSVFANAPKRAASARPQAPAEPPETPPTEPKGADLMSDTIPKAGLCKALGLADDADEDAILDALDERITAQQQATPSASKDDTVKTVVAALEADGKVVVSQAFLDTLKEGAQAGAAALARQSREDRDNAIAKAQDEGKIGRSEDAVKAWQAAWDRDPDGTAKEIADLGVRFPVGQPKGYAGDEKAQAGASQPFTEDEADALAVLAGVSKEALTNE